MENISPSVREQGTISLLDDAFSCPRWARHVDMRPFTRLPAQKPGRPKHDLVDALCGHLFYRAGMDAADSEIKLIRHATLAWDLDPETVKKQFRAYSKGEICPSKGKQLQLAKFLPSIKCFVEWPWEALYFRRFKKEPAEFDQWRQRKVQVGPEDAFWVALIAFRDSIGGADAEDQVRCTQQLLRTLDAFITHPITGLRRIELLDLVSRILHCLPAFLMPKYFSVSFALDGLLTEAERRAVLLIEDADWDYSSISLRYLASVAVHGNQGSRSLDIERQAWDFIPSVQKQNRQFDARPFLGMFSDDGFDGVDGEVALTFEQGSSAFDH